LEGITPLGNRPSEKNCINYKFPLHIEIAAVQQHDFINQKMSTSLNSALNQVPERKNHIPRINRNKHGI
jgi:hypothetical protein